MTDKKNTGVEDFDNEGTTPESNWFSFDKVGDIIIGTYVRAEEKEGKYGMQVNVTLINATLNGEKAEDVTEEYKVSVRSRHPHALTLLNKTREGQRVGIKFEKEVDTGKANPAKNIIIKFFDMDPDWNTYKLAKESMDTPKDEINVDEAFE